MEGNVKTNVLLLYAGPMNVSVNLCANMWLQKCCEMGLVSFRSVPTRSISLQDVVWADVVVVGRLIFPEEFVFCRQIKQCHRKMLYVLDDDLPNIPDSIPSSIIFSDKDVRRTVSSFIELADGLISPSPFLLKKYGYVKNHNILIEEPALDFPNPTEPRDVIRIGFAGSPDRTADIDNILSTALKSIYKQYGNRVRFYFFGATPAFWDSIEAEQIPYLDDYGKYRQVIGQLKLDIGLAPMPDTSFHACKHYNKFIEYSSLGIVGLYSNVLPYSRLATKAPILLVDNDSESWIAALSRLIDNPSLLFAKKQEVSNYAQLHFSIDVIAKDIICENKANVVFSYKVPNSNREISNKRFVADIKVSFGKRLSRAIRKYGIGGLPHAFYQKLRSLIRKVH